MASIILNTDSLTLTLNERGETNTASSLGGTSIVGTKNVSDLQFKGIDAGSNIAVTSDSDSVNIAVDIDSNLVPATSNSYKLGEGNARWLSILHKGANHEFANNRYELTIDQTTATAGYKAFTNNTAYSIDAGAADITLETDASNSVIVPENLVVNGTLDVNGTLTTIDSTNLLVSDRVIEINHGAASNSTDAGIIIERGSTGDNAAIYWNEANDRFRVATTNSDGSTTGDFGSLTDAALQTGAIVATSGISGTSASFTGALSSQSLSTGAITSTAAITTSGSITSTASSVDAYSSLKVGNNSNTNRLSIRAGTTGPLSIINNTGYAYADQKSVGFAYAMLDSAASDAEKFLGSFEIQQRSDDNHRFRMRWFNNDASSNETLFQIHKNTSWKVGINDINSNDSTGYTQRLIDADESDIDLYRRTDIKAPAESDTDSYVPVIRATSDYSHRHTTTQLDAAIAIPKSVQEWVIKTSNEDLYVVNTFAQRKNADTYPNSFIIESRDPDLSQSVDGRVVFQQNNVNFEKSVVQLTSIASGTSDPASPSSGDWFFNRTGGSIALKRYNGTAWVEPANTDGVTFYDATAHKQIIRINGAWHSQDTTAI